MPEDDKKIDQDALEKAMKLFIGMDDETLEAVTEVWMKEALTRGKKHDAC